MAFDTGGNLTLSQLEETTFGVAPSSGNPLPIRVTGGLSLELSKGILESDELRSDQQRAVVRHGNRTVEGDIPFEFSNKDFDIGLQALMGGTWVKLVDLSLTDITITASAKTFVSVATDFEALGLEVGDTVVTSGFTNGGNNGTFVLTAISTVTMTFGNATGLVDEGTADASGDFDSLRHFVEAGTTERSFTMQKRFGGLSGNQYEHFLGCEYNSLSLSVAPEQITTGTFGILGQDKLSDQASEFVGTTVAASTNQPFDSYTGFLKLAGSTIAIATNVEMTLARGLTSAFVIGSDKAPRVLPGRFIVDITMDAFLEDFTFANNFLNETETTFVLQVQFGTEWIRFTCPRLKPTEASITVPDENGVIQNLTFQALFDSTTGYNIKIDASSIDTTGI